MSERNPFLGRWSRRKALARNEAPASDEPARPATEEERRSAPADGAGNAGEVRTPFPDIESLGRDSDFSIFMREGVPDALRKQALRKLWRLDPAFSKLDGLLEYGEDYNVPARRPAVVRTAWRIGRGMAGEEPQQDAGGPEVAEAGQGGRALSDNPPKEGDRLAGESSGPAGPEADVTGERRGEEEPGTGSA